MSPELIHMIDQNWTGLWTFALGTLGLGVILGIVGIIRRN